MCQVTRSVAMEAVKAIASAIREDHNLEHLTLQMENGFTDTAGVALAENLDGQHNPAQDHLVRHCL
jgi:hypothetical protein